MAHHPGHRHEAGFYRSEAEFRALVVPFVEDGVAAGEPILIGYDEPRAGLLRSWLRDPAAVSFVSGQGSLATPGRAIATYQRLVESHLARGASQVRIAGEVPHPGTGGRFDGWDRYEAALNAVWDGLPVWGRCLYDRGSAPAAVLEAAERTHPRLLSLSGQRHPSSRYQGGSAFQALEAAPDPLERLAPAVELVDAPAAAARHALARLARGRLPRGTLEDLLIGVSEAVSNAVRHGRSPATVRMWAAAGRIVITVHDAGPGPADPLAGLLPASASAAGGMGLWLVHQLDADVSLRRGGDGFTLRLRSGGLSAGKTCWARGCGLPRLRS